MYNYELEQLKNECLTYEGEAVDLEVAKQAAHDFLATNDTAFVIYEQGDHIPETFYAHYTMVSDTNDFYLITNKELQHDCVNLILEWESAKDHSYESLDLIGDAKPVHPLNESYAKVMASLNIRIPDDPDAFRPEVYHVLTINANYVNSKFLNQGYQAKNFLINRI